MARAPPCYARAVGTYTELQRDLSVSCDTGMDRRAFAAHRQCATAHQGRPRPGRLCGEGHNMLPVRGSEGKLEQSPKSSLVRVLLRVGPPERAIVGLDVHPRAAA